MEIDSNNETPLISPLLLSHCSKEAKQHLEHIKEVLPSFVDLQDLSPTFYEDQIENLDQAIERTQKDFPELQPTVLKMVKELEVNTPFNVFDSVFSPICQKYFSNQSYQQPNISVFYPNSEFPTMVGVRKLLKQESQFQPYGDQTTRKYSKSECKSPKMQNNTGICDLNQNKIAELKRKMEEDEAKKKWHEEAKSVKLFHMENLDQTQLQVLLTKIFNFFEGRFPRIFNPMLYFPGHLAEQFTCLEELFITPGPLPFEQVYYIALMTAAASGNTYVFNLFGNLFIKLGGNPSWIQQGYEKIPVKLQKIWELVWANVYHPSILVTHDEKLFSLMEEGKIGEKLNSKEISSALLLISLTNFFVSLAQGCGLLDQNQLEYTDNELLINIPKQFFPPKTQKKGQQQFSNNQRKSETYNDQEGFSEKSSTSKRNSISKLSQESLPEDSNNALSYKITFKQKNLSRGQNCSEFQEEEQSDQSNQNSEQKKKLKKNPIQYENLNDQNDEDEQADLEDNDSHDDSEGKKQQKLKQLENPEKSCKKINQNIVTNNIITLLQKTGSEQDREIESQDTREEISSEDDNDFFEFKYCNKSLFSIYRSNTKIFNNCGKSKVKGVNLSENDYNWNTNLIEYLSEIGQQKLAKTLNKKAYIIKKMTNKNFGNKESLDTTQFRESIWNYVEILLGYKQKQESFKRIKIFLDKQFRVFLRKLVMEPWVISKNDFDQIPYLFKPEDYMHMVILVSEAKFSCRLLYGFYCLNKFQHQLV